MDVTDSQLAAAVLPDQSADLDPWRGQQLPQRADDWPPSKPWQSYQTLPSAKRHFADVNAGGNFIWINHVWLANHRVPF